MFDHLSDRLRFVSIGVDLVKISSEQISLQLVP